MSSFSFVVPVYNVKVDFLKQCLDSVLYTSMDTLEVIIVDDNSSNGCEKVCDKYQDVDHRVKVFHLDRNGGVSNARNFGIKQCTGEWIVFVDSDDWVDVNICERLMNLIDEEADVIMFSAYRDSLNNSDLIGTSDVELVYKKDISEDAVLSRRKRLRRRFRRSPNSWRVRNRQRKKRRKRILLRDSSENIRRTAVMHVTAGGSRPLGGSLSSEKERNRLLSLRTPETILRRKKRRKVQDGRPNTTTGITGQAILPFRRCWKLGSAATRKACSRCCRTGTAS